MNKPSDISKSTIKEWLEEDSSPALQSSQSEEDLIRFASAHAIEPPTHLKSKILGKIEQLNTSRKNLKKLDLNDPPVLDATSNWLDWQEAVKNIEPPENYEGIYLHPLVSSEKRDLFVAWVKEYIDEEVHHDLVESFILLEGTCECHITDAAGNARVVRMSAGDYITMSPGETHDVIITSLEPAKAILQWMKISA